MKKKNLVLILIGLTTLSAQAGNWLPEKQNPSTLIRLLECTYNESTLEECQTITSGSTDWEVRTQNLPLAETPGGEQLTFVFTAKRSLTNAGVAVAFDQYNWTSDNYVMIPASVYNGNRQRIVNRQYATGLDKTDYNRKELALTSNPIPQLSPEYGASSRLEVNISNTATPAIAWLERQRQQGNLLLTDQGIERDGCFLDHALIVEETPDRSLATFVISAPGVRELKPEFIGFSPSPDRGITVKAGEEITIRVTRFSFPGKEVPALLSRFMQVRKLHTGAPAPRNLMPMSEVFTRMVRNIDARYFKNEQFEYYCPENADWISFGWIGGLMNTYPMLTLGDAEHLRRVKSTFDFAIPRGQGESGYFYDVLGSDGNILYRDAAVDNPGIGLTRKSCDVLYWMVKQFMLLQAQGKEADISPLWEKHIRRLADAFVSTWEKYGTWGNYLEVETGNVAVYNTTSGAMAPAALALASVYYNEPKYKEIAQQAATTFYDSFALLGFTSGGCGDILQNADSETAAALMTSLMTLYETSGDRGWLEKSSRLADLCATWTVSFPYRLPDDTPLAKLGANLTGAVWASTQNKHGAPGFCTQSGDALFKIYRTTGDTLYADLLRDILHAHAEGIQPNGKITERLTYCDADSRGSRGEPGQTGWNELNGALMALEIPGIYLRTDTDSLYVFDHVTASVHKKNAHEIILAITNPTAFDAEVSILCEKAGQAAQPLGCNAFLNWEKVKVAAGKTTLYKKKTTN